MVSGTSSRMVSYKERPIQFSFSPDPFGSALYNNSALPTVLMDM